jgi:hypothetical protein
MPRRGVCPWSATLVIVDKHSVQKLRRGQEILAATPAIDLQILVGTAWPANYQADRQVRFAPRAEIKGAERAPFKPSTEGKKNNCRENQLAAGAGRNSYCFWCGLDYHSCLRVPGSAVESKLRNGSHRLKRSGSCEAGQFFGFPC